MSVFALPLAFFLAFSPARFVPGEVVYSTPSESVIVTCDGEEWSVLDTLPLGSCIVTFDRARTPSIYDDVIIGVEPR